MFGRGTLRPIANTRPHEARNGLRSMVWGRATKRIGLMCTNGTAHRILLSPVRPERSAGRAAFSRSGSAGGCGAGGRRPLLVYLRPSASTPSVRSSAGRGRRSHSKRCDRKTSKTGGAQHDTGSLPCPDPGSPYHSHNGDAPGPPLVSSSGLRKTKPSPDTPCFTNTSSSSLRST
jgi:hypothetical protein